MFTLFTTLRNVADIQFDPYARIRYNTRVIRTRILCFTYVSKIKYVYQFNSVINLFSHIKAAPHVRQSRLLLK